MTETKINSLIQFCDFSSIGLIFHIHAWSHSYRQFWHECKCQEDRGDRRLQSRNFDPRRGSLYRRRRSRHVEGDAYHTQHTHTHARAHAGMHEVSRSRSQRALFNASTGRRAYVDARYYAHSYTRIPLTAVSHPLGVPRWNVTHIQAHVTRTQEHIPRACVRAYVRTCLRTLDRGVDRNNSLPFSVITISSFSLFRVSTHLPLSLCISSFSISLCVLISVCLPSLFL